MRAHWRIGKLFPLDRQATILAWIVPPKYRYPAALRVCRLRGLLRGFTGGNARLTEAFLLDLWLRKLTTFGAFPIPTRLIEAKVLGCIRAGEPVLFCSTHLPLYDIPLRVIIELGYDPWIVADRGNIIQNAGMIVPGLEQTAKTIPANLWSLTRLRTVLRSGGVAAYLADAEVGSPLSRAPMSVAASTGARIVFYRATRLPDGVIEVSFLEPPFANPRDDLEIAANLDALRRENNRIYAELGLPGVIPSVSHPVSARGQRRIS